MRKLLLLFLLIPMFLFGQDNLTPNNWINDYCGVLTTDQITILNTKISEFEKQTDIEITVAIVNTLEDKDIESFSNTLFKKWKIGKKDRDNGLLVVIAPNERQWRVEIGYGLEPYLTDYESFDIASKNFSPNFKLNDYFTGISGFINESTKLLGNKSWEDRVAYKEKIDKENREKTIVFFRYVLYLIIFIAILILFIFISITLVNKKKAYDNFLILRKQRINSYKEKIYTLNLLGKIYNISLFNEDIHYINLIKNSTINNLEHNYLEAINSFSEYENRLETINELTSKSIDLKKQFSYLNKKEKSNNLDETEFVKIEWSNNSEISILVNKITLIKSQMDLYSDRISKIEKFEKILSVGNITSDYINNLIDEINNSFLDKKYKPDCKKIEEYKIKLIESASQFNMITKKFDNLQNISNSLDTFNFIKNRLDDYLSDIYSKNKKYDNMVSVLNDHPNTIKNHTNELNRYLSKSDVSSSTKSAIRSFLITLLAFKVTSDVFDSFDRLSNLESKSIELIDRSKKEIKRAEQKREEEEEKRLRSSSYGYGNSTISSYGSSNSGSSFGGFGGGNSGGGGSSGSW